MIRRQFLAALAAARLSPILAAPKFSVDPFQLGVCSGDPLPDGVVLWTRLLGEQLGNANHEVDYIVAEDEGLKKIVKKGRAVASPQFAHSVHADVRGLKPGRWYFYQFRSGGFETPVARTRTAPAPASNEALRFAFASCQHYETGYYTAYKHMAEEDLQLVVHLGDYIYEGGISENRPRKHTGPEIKSLSDYRNRHALYKSDEHLKLVHARFPWIITWDDHEVDNNYADDKEEHGAPRDGFLERRANAYQAYYEHMPLRETSLPHGSHLKLHRRFDFGNLARFHVLDTRQYRTDQPCGDGRKVQCEAALSDSATILGAEQYQWLTEGMKSGKQAWNILANQVLFSKIDAKPGEGAEYSMDQWSGYEMERRKLLRFMQEAKVPHPIVITGDIHSNWASDIKADFADPKSATIGSEFVGTSITSAGDGLELPAAEEGFKRDNPHLHFFLAKRGYVSCTVNDKQWRTDYRMVPYVTRPGAPLETKASFIVDAKKPGMQRA
jgi:alkaline phosphatase D